MKKEKGSLTDRQVAFVEYYVVGFNATDAAKKAGYSEKASAQAGSYLLRVPKVAALIQERREKLTETTQFTKATLVEGLVTLFRGATIARNYHGAARVGELLAKLHGMIIERRDVRVIRSIEDLTDEELAALEVQARARAAQGGDTRH